MRMRENCPHPFDREDYGQQYFKRLRILSVTFQQSFNKVSCARIADIDISDFLNCLNCLKNIVDVYFATFMIRFTFQLKYF